MQKAIYYVSRIFAARGIIELTDRKLNFQVSPFDASFGVKDIEIDLCSIIDLKIEGGELHPKVAVVCADRKHEFVLSRGQELYDRLRATMRDPLQFSEGAPAGGDAVYCCCGNRLSADFRFCPSCGRKRPPSNL